MRLSRRGSAAEIPTSSMADVAFLLIIFFLVASFYSVTRGIQFSLPRHDEAALGAKPEAAVLIEVAANGSFTVDGRAMSLAALSQYLAPKLARNPEKAVILHTSLAAPYHAMTDVFDELSQAGVEHLIIPTRRELHLYGLRDLL